MDRYQVDTTLPEYSWIPFYEELAQKLVNEGWRFKQPELVQMLKEMRDEGVPMLQVIDTLHDHIDPFTVFALFTYDLGWDKKRKVMEAFKFRFSMKSNVPTAHPVVPTAHPLGLCYFPLDNRAESNTFTLWNMFEFVMGIDDYDETKLTRLVDECLGINGVAMSKLTMGLYWVDPYNFLHIHTINGVAKLVSGEQLKSSGTGDDYLRCLQKTRKIDLKPFPIMNYEVYKETYQLPGTRPRVWTVLAQRGQWTDTFVSNGYVGLHYDMDAENMSEVSNPEEIRRRVERVHDDKNPHQRGRIISMFNSFILEMKSGDYIITPDFGQDLHYGRLTHDGSYYINHEDGLPCWNRRLAHWIKEPLKRDDLPSINWQNRRTVAEVKESHQLNEFFALIAPHKPCPYTIQSMLDEGVFLEHEEIERMLNILQNKKNMILQGPPGVGKTFIARKLAYVLMGEKADAQITSVQFHQSYSYEDFVGGLRPDVSDDQQLIFTPQDGTFLRLCDRARNDDSDNKYVMLIDEVNRGNLSRVFGELLMLIEADKRTQDNAIELQHQTSSSRAIDNNDDDDGKADKFFVPENIYIIGTMNLADRSLTGMNIAMRRRFGFIELEPQFDKDVFKDWLSDKTNMPNDMQTRIHSKMSALNDAIAQDVSLGKNYAVGHSFFCPSEEVTDWEEWYRMVIKYEIRPLLEEYWFDDLDKAKEHADNLLKG